MFSPLCRRRADHGAILISTLLMLILLASIAMLVQQRAMAAVRVFDRLADGTRAALQHQSAFTAVQPILRESLVLNTNAPGMEPIALNGTRYQWEWAGARYEIQAWDPQSMPDLWLTEPTVLTQLLPLSEAQVLAFRADHLRESILHPLQARALLGLEAEDLFTISGKEARLNIRNWPVQAAPWAEMLQQWQVWDTGAEVLLLCIQEAD